jgi:hypothetical protein
MMNIRKVWRYEKAERSAIPMADNTMPQRKEKKKKRTNTGRHSTTEKTGVDSCGTQGNLHWSMRILYRVVSDESFKLLVL